MTNILTHSSDIYFGVNEENDVGRYIKYQSVSKALIVYRNNTRIENDLLDKVYRSLSIAGIEYISLNVKEDNLRIESVFEGLKLSRTEEVDFILAIGGRAEYDCAKIIAAELHYHKNFFDLFSSNDELDDVLPIGVISTAISGGEAYSNFANVYQELGDGSLLAYSRMSPLFSPRFTIYSPHLCDLRIESLRHGVVAILSALFIRYFSQNQVTELALAIIEAELKNNLLMLRRIKDETNIEEGIANLIWSSVNTYTSELFLNNKKSSIDILIRATVCTFDCHYAKASSVIILAWFRYLITKEAPKVARLGHNLFNVFANYLDLNANAKSAVQKLKELYKAQNFPLSLMDLGGDASDIKNILKKAGFPQRVTIGESLPLDETTSEVILHMALEG